MPGIDVGVIQQFLHPPLGLLTIKTDTAGPYAAGSHTLTTWSDSGTTKQIQNTNGVIAVLNGALPPELGYYFGWDGGGGPLFSGDLYNDRMIQLVTMHSLLLGLGADVMTECFEQYRPAEMHLWHEANPDKLGLHVAPGLAFDLLFLVTV